MKWFTLSLLSLSVWTLGGCQQDQRQDDTQEAVSEKSTLTQTQLLEQWEAARVKLPTSPAPTLPEERAIPRHAQLSARLDVLGPAKGQAQSKLVEGLIAKVGEHFGDERGVVGISHQLSEDQAVSMGVVASDSCATCVALKLEFGSIYAIDLPLYKGEKEAQTSMTLVAPLSFMQEDGRLVVYLDLKNVGDAGMAYISSKFSKLPDKIEEKIEQKIQHYWTSYLVERVPTIRLGTLPLPELGADILYMPAEVLIDPMEQALHLTLGTNLPEVSGQLDASAPVLREQDSVAMSVHPGALVSAARLAMGRGELALRYDAQGQPADEGRYGLILEGVSPDEEGFAVNVSVYDFEEAWPRSSKEVIRVSAPEGKMQAVLSQHAPYLIDQSHYALFSRVVGSWMSTYETWTQSAYLGTSRIEVGLLQTQCSAERISWHAGVILH